ncbi:hypothetical protein KPL71_026430 [Citrus sinensis]|uniref:Uncharacterized protein n=1 Tax=Citrus sinensis TaxID=2711 RepID=A0ACB8HZ98_CITSI|nr:hypothetical protein KPL71_026430 [Citrus sinensis]
MILAESPDIPTIIQIPRQIPRADLLKIMPLEWITNYEHFHQNTTPVQTSEPMYEKRPDGSVRLQFKPPPSAPVEPPRLSFTCLMVQPVDNIPEVLPSGKTLPIIILMATKNEDPSTSTATPIVEDSSSDAENKAFRAEPEPSMPPPVPDHSTKPSSTSWITFDDIPHHKWSARLQEFAAWIDLRGTKPNAQSQAVLREFMARSTGSLRDWLESLGEYRQLQFMQSPIGTTLNIIHEQFISEKTASTDVDRKEYHKMKRCSLKRHLLESHYKRMSILFYKLNGFNEPSLKHVFIASLPSELQPDLQRKLTATNLSIVDISLGKIFQMAMFCLDKICEQKEFFKDLMEDKKYFSEACKKPYLKIECKDEKKCVCPTKKKRHF